MTNLKNNVIKKIVIIGAGPAGLTAGIELQKLGLRDITIIEADGVVGGISKTVVYRGNRIDIGGHRFFSKSQWVMNWWAEFLPIEIKQSQEEIRLSYQGQTKTISPVAVFTQASDAVMMVRNRLSRIYFNRKFFDYPLKLNTDTLNKIGLKKTFLFGCSYLGAKLKPRKPELSLEDFLINRFGRKLFEEFFKEYTEKVWGVPCSKISAEWGAQRIKSLSVLKTIIHAFQLRWLNNLNKKVPTSLIENFLYPKQGPGQMWETVARKFQEQGGELLLNSSVSAIQIEGGGVQSVSYRDHEADVKQVDCDYLISTMPIKDLVAASKESWKPDVLEIAEHLAYRDFVTVGLLYRQVDLQQSLNDNWIYIQEPGVKVGRVQVFNNWSPYMVADPNNAWLGLEYFCQESDDLWQMSDDQLIKLSQQEMHDIGLVFPESAMDAVVLKVPKAYPGYFGEAYQDFDKLQQAIDAVKNLFLIGRNGMHRYNNQDHSMLTAAEAAQQIASGMIDKSKIWAINVDDSYHEEVGG